MLIEQWVRWKPLQELSVRYMILNFSDTQDGFKLLLEDFLDDTKQVQVHFGHSVLFYMETSETCRVQTMTMLSELYGDDFYICRTFFQVTQSALLSSIIQDYGDSYPQGAIKHFVIKESEYYVDIIATEEPIFEWV